jgi:hypothetical protein
LARFAFNRFFLVGAATMGEVAGGGLIAFSAAALPLIERTLAGRVGTINVEPDRVCFFEANRLLYARHSVD